MCAFTERLFALFRWPRADDNRSARQHSATAAPSGPLPLSMPPRTRGGKLFLLAQPVSIAIAPVVHFYARNMNEADAKTALIFVVAARWVAPCCLGWPGCACGTR